MKKVISLWIFKDTFTMLKNEKDYKINRIDKRT